MTKRGEPLPINQALNRATSQTRVGPQRMDGIIFVCVTVFLVGLRVVAMIALSVACHVSAWLIVPQQQPEDVRALGLECLSQRSLL